MTQTASSAWTCARIATNLEPYLTGAHSEETMAAIRGHLDTCPACWHAWNRFRWDRARNSPLYHELKTFEGPRFRPYFDSSRTLAAEWDAAAPTTEHEVRAFYAQSRSYLYNLAIWEASGHRPAYMTAALPLLKRAGCRKVLDYGSGIGSDIIALRAEGFAVRGCELPSPHNDFARWRLRIRHHDDRITHPDHVDDLRDWPPNALWIIDTIDHLQNIDAALGPLLHTIRVVVTENVGQHRAHGRQRFHLRRTPTELHNVFARYGLTRTPTKREEIAWWTKRT